MLKLSPGNEARPRDVVLGLYFDAVDSLMKFLLIHPTDLAVSYSKLQESANNFDDGLATSWTNIQSPLV